MTTYCLSSTGRSRPTAFLIAVAGGNQKQPSEPVPPNYSVDTPFDDPLDDPGEEDAVPPFSRPSKRGRPDEEHGLP